MINPQMILWSRQKKHLDSVSNNIAEYLLAISDNVTKFIDSQQNELLTITENMEAAVRRSRSAEEYMATLYSTKFCTYKRPVQSIRILRTKLEEAELPKWARTKAAWKPVEKFTYTELERVGAIAKHQKAQQMARQNSSVSPRSYSFRSAPYAGTRGGGGSFSGSPFRPSIPPAIPRCT